VGRLESKGWVPAALQPARAAGRGGAPAMSSRGPGAPRTAAGAAAAAGKRPLGAGGRRHAGRSGRRAEGAGAGGAGGEDAALTALDVDSQGVVDNAFFNKFEDDFDQGKL
jgi:hypothetical protein